MCEECHEITETGFHLCVFLEFSDICGKKLKARIPGGSILLMQQVLKVDHWLITVSFVPIYFNILLNLFITLHVCYFFNDGIVD